VKKLTGSNNDGYQEAEGNKKRGMDRLAGREKR